MFTVLLWTALHCLSLYCGHAASRADYDVSVSEVVRLSDGLAPKLLQFVYNERKDFVVSPFGLISNLAMIMEGVDEKSREEISSSLGVRLDRKHSWQAYRDGFETIFQEFEDRKENSDVSGAFNNVVIHSPLPLVPKYKSLLKKVYKANVTQFKPNSTVTEHVMEVSSDTGVISHWKDYRSLAVYTYLEQGKGPFTGPGGDSVIVPMIPLLSPNAGYVPALNSLSARVNLEDNNCDLFVIMPDSREYMERVLRKLDALNMTSLLQSLPRKHYEVSVPQFSIILNDLDLRPFVRSIGVKRIFRTGRSDGSTTVSKLSQNSYFGTSFIGLKSVASASSTMKRRTTGSGRRERRDATKIEFNKPFIFCLIHKRTGLIILNGVVTTPQQNPQ